MIRYSKLLFTGLGLVFLLSACKNDKATTVPSNETIDAEIKQEIDSLNQVIDSAEKEIDALLEDI